MKRAPVEHDRQSFRRLSAVTRGEEFATLDVS
jgi:hypothetical protein